MEKQGDELTIGELETIPEFARKRAASDEHEYATAVAEGKDLAYLVENTCIHCNRLIKKGEVKILPPGYIQERDPYVSNGTVKRRLMCISCYNTIRSTTREKVRFDRYRDDTRPQLFRTAIKMLANR
jgi:hypothetical protein